MIAFTTGFISKVYAVTNRSQLIETKTESYESYTKFEESNYYQNLSREDLIEIRKNKTFASILQEQPFYTETNEGDIFPYVDRSNGEFLSRYFQSFTEGYYAEFSRAELDELNDLFVEVKEVVLSNRVGINITETLSRFVTTYSTLSSQLGNSFDLSNIALDEEGAFTLSSLLDLYAELEDVILKRATFISKVLRKIAIAWLSRYCISYEQHREEISEQVIVLYRELIKFHIAKRGDSFLTENYELLISDRFIVDHLTQCKASEQAWLTLSYLLLGISDLLDNYELIPFDTLIAQTTESIQEYYTNMFVYIQERAIVYESSNRYVDEEFVALEKTSINEEGSAGQTIFRLRKEINYAAIKAVSKKYSTYQ